MSFRSFISSPDFRKTVIRIVLLYGGIIGLSWFWLRWYTDHGEYVSVPDLRGVSLDEAVTSLEDRQLKYLVIDSIYDKKAEPGTVMEQSPAPESQVKQGRQVFLTIYRISPPMEKLGVKEGDFATVAMIKLANKGIEYDTLYEDNNTLVGSIIRVTRKGRRLKPDELIPRGSSVTLVIGRSVKKKVIVPNLRGFTCREAEAALDTLNLVCNCRFEGIDFPSAQDSSTFRVCRQDPEHDPLIGSSAGRIVDLWLYNSPCPRDTSDNH